MGWLRRLCGGLVAEAMWWVGVGVVIIELKANLSSTSHLTSQLELSFAILQLLLENSAVILLIVQNKFH